MFLEAPKKRIVSVFVSESLHTQLKNTKDLNKNYAALRNKLSGLEYEIVADAIYEKMSDTVTPQGVLAVVKSPEYTLSEISRQLGYGDYVFLSRGEKMTGGMNRSSILCDLFESVLGGIYLDGGIEAAKAGAGVTEQTETWAGWKALGFRVIHGSKALFGADLIHGSKGDGAIYKARFFGASQVRAVA